MSILFAHWRRTLLIIFGVALATRLAFVFFALQDGFYFVDSIFYSSAAVDLLAKGSFGTSLEKAPGYPLFLAAVYALFGENIMAVRVMESVIGALLAVLIARLGKRIGGEAVGVIAGGLWSIYPMGVFIVGLVYPTNLTAFLLALGVSLVLPSPNEEFRANRVFLGGLSYGFAALTIPVALLSIIAVAGWVFYYARRSRLWFASLFLLGSALTIVPWTARNYAVHGRLILVQPNVERHLPRIRTAENPDPDNKVKTIVRRPDLFALQFGRNFVRFWELYPDRVKMSNPEYRERLHAKHSRVVKETIYNSNRLINAISILSTAPLFFFAVIGAAAMWLTRYLWRELSMLWITVLSFAVGYAFFVGRIRYRIPVDPYIIILSAYGIQSVYSKVAARFDLLSFGRKKIETSEQA